jgi:MraZ protein
VVDRWGIGAYGGAKWREGEGPAPPRGARWVRKLSARFFGRHEHSLDVKGRVILPARFRREFDSHAYLSQFHDRCLALWTPEEFERQMEEMESAQDDSRDERNAARYWAANSAEVELDKQGRLPIPNYLRDFARLEGAVLVNGAINRVELWNPDEWERRMQSSEQRWTEDSEVSQ